MNGFGIDWQEVVRRALKYLFEGLAVAVAAYYIQKNASLQESMMVALVASSTLAVLDLYAPAIGGSARLGMGLVAGSGAIGGF